MKKHVTRAAVVCAVAVLWSTLYGCRDATRTPGNQELTKQRQEKIQKHKDQDSVP